MGMTFEERQHLSQFFKSRMVHSYIRLRMGLGVIALAFPVLLVVGGWHLTDTPTQTSMSSYYHTPMRNTFVGCLCAIGAFLYLYKGYGWLENIALNAAGVLIVGVAIFPMELPQGAAHTYTNPQLHGVCAIAFFLCIAYVCIFRSGDTLKFFDAAHRRYRVYRFIYKTLGLLMIALPAAVFALLYSRDAGHLDRLAKDLAPNSDLVAWLGRHNVLALECIASAVFATYWLVKTVELNGSEKMAITT